MRASLRPQLLLVLQNRALRSLIGAELLEEGYGVRGLETLEEALSLMGSDRIRPALVILDTLEQPLTLASLDSLPADLPLLVLTGPLDPGGPLLADRPLTRLLRKPFTIRELVDAADKICYKDS
jgi:DNA-binding response OmpR family regulator